MDASPPSFPSTSSITPPPLYSPSTSINNGLTWRRIPLDEKYGPEEDPTNTIEDFDHSRLGTAMVEQVLPSEKSIRRDG